MDSMKIAMSGLNTFRTAMGTTAHNIANSETDGYSRQRVEIQSNVPQPKDGIFTGNGAHVSTIRRVTDEFTSDQIRSLSSEEQRLDKFNKMASRIDTMLAEDSTSLTPAMQSFFNAIEKLNTDPASPTTRQLVLTEGENLVSRFHTQFKQVSTLYDEVNGNIAQEVDEINSIADNLAALNVAILNSGAQGTLKPPNDLLDQQEKLLKDLSQHIGININRQSNGMIDVYAGNGIGLVSSDKAINLEVGRDPADPTKNTVTQKGIDITTSLSGGSLGGVLDFRREMLDQTMNKLGRQATVLGMTFNEQHQKGINLYDEPGSDFFRVDKPSVVPGYLNTGSAVASAETTDPTALTTSDYSVTFNGTDYRITRLADEYSQIGPLPADIDGLHIDITGSAAAGDSFLIRPTINGAKNIGLAIGNGAQIAAAAPMRSTSELANIGDGKITTPLVVDKDDTNLTNPVTITFDTATTYQIIDAGSGSSIGSGTYSDNGEISFNGLSVRITGEPAAGDSFRITPNTSGSADNSNGLLLSNLQLQKVVEGNGTLQEGYATIVNDVGGLTRQTAIHRDAQQTLLDNAEAVRDSISGVDLDEEAANLARFQQAYQAAAQVIAITKSLFDTVLDATRR